MKKVIGILFVASLITLTACGSKKSDLLTGSWKLGDMSSEAPKELPDSLRKREEAQTKIRAEEMKKSYSFDFNKNGTYVIKVMGSEAKGSWKLNEDATKLTLMDEDAKEKTGETGDLVELTANRMVFTMDVSGIKQKLVLVK
jgi:hypothetical protein